MNQPLGERPPEVAAVVPAGFRDPARPSGGNVYDARVLDGLKAAGWGVSEIEAPGSWPRAEPPAFEWLTQRLRTLADGSLLLIDGLIASGIPELLVPLAARLRLVVLVHLPLAVESPRDAEVAAREGAVLTSAERIIVTSRWCRDALLARYPLDPQRISVAAPGTDGATTATGTAEGSALLSVGPITPAKGTDVLISALETLASRSPSAQWTCRIVGSLRHHPDFSDRLVARAERLGGRVTWAGVLGPTALRAAYAQSDLLVHPSLGETYGMVLTEALAHGLPVVASRVGGVPEAVGTVDGVRPGLLLPPGDSGALAGALQGWLADARLRKWWRETAGARRAALAGWPATAATVGSVLTAAASAAVAAPLSPAPCGGSR